MKTPRILVALAASLFLATACADTSSPSTVRLLVHDSFAVSEELISDFERETGYQLEVIKAGDAGSMVASAVLAAGSPSADVLYGIDATLLQRALDAEVFESYSSAAAANLRTDLMIDEHVTPIDFGDVCVNIDDSYFSQRKLAVPDELGDLVKPAYRGLLVVQDPGASSPGLAFLLATIDEFGSGWEGYWAKLLANGTKVAGSWSDAYYSDFSLNGGEFPLVVSYATSPPAEIVFAESPKPTSVSTSVMSRGCYRQVEYAGVLRGAANPEGAQAVVEWLAGKSVQEDIPLSMFVFPARSDAALPQVFQDFAGIAERPSQIEPTVLRESLAIWLATWDSLRNG